MCLLYGYGQGNEISNTCARIKQRLDEKGVQSYCILSTNTLVVLHIGEQLPGGFSILKGLGIHSLWANGIGLRDLKGIEQLHDLKDLNIAENDIADISLLRCLPLERLDLSRNHRLSNLTPAVSEKLRQLVIFETSVTNYNCLADSRLESLIVGALNTCALSSITNIASLKELRFGREEGLDYTVLANMKIETLFVRGLLQSDVKWVSRLPLKKLVVSGDDIFNLHYLKNLKLVEFSLCSNGISDLDGVEEMPLERLTLVTPNVRNISALSNLLSLAELNLYCEKYDLSHIEKLKLKRLCYNSRNVALGENTVKKIKTLKHCVDIDYSGFQLQF
jgi:Leucine-rich repeat (LRR) protein